jgi:hypothetical protein
MLSVTLLQEYVQVILEDVAGVALLMQEAELKPAFVKYCCTASAATLIEHGVQVGVVPLEGRGSGQPQPDAAVMEFEATIRPPSRAAFVSTCFCS